VVGTFKNLTEIKRSEMELKRSFEKLQSAMSSTIDAVSLIVESRDPYTAGQQRRVAQLAVAIARELGLTGRDRPDSYGQPHPRYRQETISRRKFSPNRRG
jgi:HD-GYP domain-containing protein (c-di-GMP phosphodiesterase class II)